MLTLFISYHPDDAPTLGVLLDWLDPFRHKYFLRIWYNRYDSSDEENVIEYTDALHNANIYIFLISQKWVADRKIQTKEVEVAIERMHQLGKEWVSLLPVQVKPCQWRNFSKLVELEGNTLPSAKKELIKYDPRDEAYQLISEKLNSVVVPLRERLIEDAKLRNLPTSGFYTLVQTPKEKAPRRGAIRITLEDIKSWTIAALLLFLILCVYYIGCNSEPYR